MIDIYNIKKMCLDVIKIRCNYILHILKGNF